MASTHHPALRPGAQALPDTGANTQLKPSRQAMARLAASCFLGTVVEWYDFMLYGFLGPLVFGKLFFPRLDATVGIIAVFGIFAVGFMARPLGGLFFGHFGDKLGRKPVMAATLIMMGLATAAMGVLPTYQQVGWCAPALLVLLRFLQGFALGGESTGAPVLMMESAPEGARGRFSSLAQAGNFAGVVMATLVVSIVARLHTAELLAWGWRVPFLFSLVLVVLGWYIRSRVQESPVFARQAAEGTARLPLAEVIGRYKKPALIVFCCALSESSFFYLTSIFGLSYGVGTLHLDRSILLQGILLGNVVAIPMTPLMGALSDRLGRRAVLGTGFVLGALFVGALFPVLQTRNPLYVFLMMAASPALIQTMHIGVTSSFYPEQFPTARVRFSGVSFGRQFGTIFGGGLMPMIATALLSWSHGGIVPILIYYVAFSVISVGAVIAAPETRRSRV